MRVDVQSVIGGGILTVTGAFTAIYAQTHYDLGTLSRMGPGLFPVALGCILAALGAITLIGGLRRSGEWPEFELRSLIFVILAVVIFALSVGRVGLAPAIIFMTVPAAAADGRLGTLGSLLLSGILAVVAVLLFIVALGLPMPIARWPF